MKWYLAKIVFQIICGSGEHTAQFDEQLRLIAGEDGADALAKAMYMGQHEQENFYNHDQQIVQWKFINIPELYQLNAMTDGAEIYSRIEEQDNAAAYLAMINSKAAAIQNTFSEKILQQP